VARRIVSNGAALLFSEKKGWLEKAQLALKGGFFPWGFSFVVPIKILKNFFKKNKKNPKGPLAFF
jgi:hypothetical protein